MKATIKTAAVFDPNGGVPLTSAVRLELERRLGRCLDDVRVHDGPAAWISTSLLGVRAYSHGSHLFFAQGAYRPDTIEGVALLAEQLGKPEARKDTHRVPAPRSNDPAHQAHWRHSFPGLVN